MKLYIRSNDSSARFLYHQGDILPEYVDEVVVADGETVIGESAFREHSKLRKIILPDSVKTIEKFAFMDCTNLQGVVLSQGLKTIGTQAFYRCTNLRNINIPSSVTKIGDTAFAWNGLTTLVVPSSIRSMGVYAFSHNENLTRVVFQDGLKKISANAFYYCTNLSEVVIPDSVVDIGNEAFEGCPITDRRVIEKFEAVSIEKAKKTSPKLAKTLVNHIATKINRFLRDKDIDESVYVESIKFNEQDSDDSVYRYDYILKDSEGVGIYDQINVFLSDAKEFINRSPSGYIRYIGDISDEIQSILEEYLEDKGIDVSNLPEY